MRKLKINTREILRFLVGASFSFVTEYHISMFRYLTFRLLPHYSSLMPQRNLPKVFVCFRDRNFKFSTSLSSLHPPFLCFEHCHRILIADDFFFE